MGIAGRRRLGGTTETASRPCRRLAGFALVAMLVGAAPIAVQAADVTVEGSAMNRFGRLALKFDRPTKVTVRAANGVLVIGFAEPSRILREKLTTDLPGYVSAVRRDPDNTGLRLGLTGAFQPNLLEAGERVFIDLLPANWSGLAPGLPPEIVAELAERARAAEAKLREQLPARPAEAPKAVLMRAAELPNLTRFVFEPPAGTQIRIVPDVAGPIAVEFSGSLALNENGIKPRSAGGIAEFVVRRGERRLSVTVGPSDGYAARAFEENGTVVLDVSRPSKEAAAALPEPPPTPAKKPAEPPTTPPKTLASAAAAPSATPAPTAAPSDATAGSAGPAPQPPAVAVDVPTGIVRQVTLQRTGPRLAMLFPVAAATPAAAFERGGRLTLVLETHDRIELPAADADGQVPLAGGQVPLAGGVLPQAEIVRLPGFSVIHLASNGLGAPRLVPEAQGWRLVFGGAEALPPDALTVTRGLDAGGHTQIVVGLQAATPTRWIRDPTDGARIAVVAAANRPQAVATARRFVDFNLPATLNGVAVEAMSDELTVVAGAGGVVIGTPAGLTVSEASAGHEGVREESPPILTREQWVRDGAGDVYRSYQEAVSVAAEAPRTGRSEIRYKLARLLVANGMDAEASSILAFARSEDPVFGARREALVLAGIAAVRSGRLKEARTALSMPGLGEDPEARLWRAVIDAREGRARPALDALLKSAATLRAYPESVTGAIRLTALKAALAAGQTGRAESELAAIDRLSTDAVPRDETDLARAQIDDALGRPEPALKAYERLAAEATRPVAAEATLRFIRLAGRLSRIDPEDARLRLETLAVAWRGDDTELATIADLARLHEAAGRWREMFAMTRLASRQFADREVTRALYDDTARVFETLLLGQATAKLTPVETLSLYHDFKEFAPVGRRGDEIVRKLADRLVELDLLGQAADLLQYQVDARLTGAARSAVAARLAAVRLMNNQPVQALAALHATRQAELPESVRHVRLLLEARALADVSRIDLALEVTDGEDGADFARLRAGILFGARRWRAAGEAGEALLGLRWKEPGALTDRERLDVMRSGVAYVLGGERLDLDRLGQKFAAKMADSPDAKDFELLMRPDAADGREFRRLVVEATRQDGLRELLRDWNAASSTLPSGAAILPAARAG